MFSLNRVSTRLYPSCMRCVKILFCGKLRSFPKEENFVNSSQFFGLLRNFLVNSYFPLVAVFPCRVARMSQLGDLGSGAGKGGGGGGSIREAGG